jgi:hypothetical protein
MAIAIVISTTSTTTNNKDKLLSQECIKALVAIIGIVEKSTIGIGPRLQEVQQHHIGQAETTSCWIDDFEGYPEGCTFQHKCSFFGVDVRELWSIRVT